ncbi:phage virion morphogenesis protein [Acidovorax sp. SUPP3334]|uniref:phage virion morphogenesis protein n=1 Tax=Acidovorax sp. SUPP3334 TaxID=2920881 RepID=UPI0023DE2559|nr:phage virion morphogenesis protein [Acidovorax sp. SUPP3334]GKT21669.1 phage virion morphogenesis protein [Acidovorax sp. SUPP3334]
MIVVGLDAAGFQQGLRQLQSAAVNLLPVYEDIGQELVNTTRRRFETSTAPDGTPWEPNSPVTMGRMIGANMRKKDGTLNKRGEQRMASKKPLIGETRLLSTEIHSVVGPTGVTVGSNKVQAAMMQFGGTKEDFPHLWGDIPARPFVGLSGADEREIRALMLDHLQRAARR